MSILTQALKVKTEDWKIEVFDKIVNKKFTCLIIQNITKKDKYIGYPHIKKKTKIEQKLDVAQFFLAYLWVLLASWFQFY